VAEILNIFGCDFIGWHRHSLPEFVLLAACGQPMERSSRLPQPTRQPTRYPRRGKDQEGAKHHKGSS
jgi:hypothetical protein